MKYPEKINWNAFSANSNKKAIKLLKSKPKLINLTYLLVNSNSDAIELIKNYNCINNRYYYSILSANSNAIELLEQNKDKIDLDEISQNPAIFTYDYNKIKMAFTELKEELLIKALNPKRMLRLMSEYGEEEIYKNYFDD
jgi:hypothetical protein